MTIPDVLILAAMAGIWFSMLGSSGVTVDGTSSAWTACAAVGSCIAILTAARAMAFRSTMKYPRLTALGVFIFGIAFYIVTISMIGVKL